MASPIGFSVGDIFAVAEFIHSVKKALEQSSGSAAQYAGVTSTLRSFEHALQQIQQIGTEESEQQDILLVANALKRTLEKFEKKVLTYQPALAGCSTEKRWKGILQKIKWQREARPEVQWFQAEVQAHATALSLMLPRMVIAAQNRSQKRTSQLISNVERRLVWQQTAQVTMTTHIVQVLEAITQLKTTLILLQTLICGLVCFLQRAIRTIPVQVSVRASVMFEDAHGDIYHIDALFIDSWRAFHIVLTEKFVDRPGWTKVASGQYRLHDRFGASEIDATEPYRAVFRPGRHIRMSILFEWYDITPGVCPKCGDKVRSNLNDECVCPNCNLSSLPVARLILEEHSGDQSGLNFTKQIETAVLTNKHDFEHRPIDAAPQLQTRVSGRAKAKVKPADFARISVRKAPEIPTGLTTADGKFVCPYCSKVRTTEYSARRHLKRHTRPYGCTFPGCYKRFGSRERWYIHETSRHSFGEWWRCNLLRSDGGLCGDFIHTEQNFDNHLASEHGLEEETPEARDYVKSMHLGTGGHYNYWCGFCNTRIAQDSGFPVSATKVREIHMWDHYEREGAHINDWICLKHNERKGSITKETPETRAGNVLGMTRAYTLM